MIARRHLFNCLMVLIITGNIYLLNGNTNDSVRLPPNEVIENYLSDPDYIYDRRPPPPASFFEKFLNYIINQLEKFFSSEEYEKIHPYLKWANIVLFTILILYFILKKYKSKDGRLILAAPKGPESDFDIRTVTEEDLSSLAEYYYSRGQYKEAARLLYLKCIKSLSLREILEADKRKTNWDYVSEIRDPEIKNAFVYATGFFEKVWYGGEAVTESEYLSWRTKLTDSGLML